MDCSTTTSLFFLQGLEAYSPKCFHLVFLKNFHLRWKDSSTTWLSFLRLVASHCEIEGENKNAFILKFEACDPNLNPMGCTPLKLKRGDDLYDYLAKNMTEVYKKSQRKLGIQFQKTARAEKLLEWLIEEYKFPKIIIWAHNGSEDTGIKLDSFLRDLNYLDQCHMVERAMECSKVAKVLLVQANGHFTPKWLTKRLFLKVPNHSESKTLAIIANPRWNQDLNLFWRLISNHARDLEGSDDINPNKILESLRIDCKKQPLVIVIYDIQELTPYTLNRLLADFWGGIVNELDDECCDCILFLVKDLNMEYHIDADYGVNLPAWDCVTVDHIQRWLKPSEVHNFLEKCTEGNAGNSCLYSIQKEKKSTDKLGSPEEILIKICKAFDLDGPAALEYLWKISS